MVEYFPRRVDRLRTARRFCQLYAGGWTQVEAAKLAGAEAARARRARPGAYGHGPGGSRGCRSLLYAPGAKQGSDRNDVKS